MMLIWGGREGAIEGIGEVTHINPSSEVTSCSWLIFPSWWQFLTFTHPWRGSLSTRVLYMLTHAHIHSFYFYLTLLWNGKNSESGSYFREKKPVFLFHSWSFEVKKTCYKSAPVIRSRRDCNYEMVFDQYINTFNLNDPCALHWFSPCKHLLALSLTPLWFNYRSVNHSSIQKRFI